MIKYSDTQNTKYIYWTTSDFTVVPQNLLSDLRIYCSTSEFTVRPQSFTVRPGFLEVQILVLPELAEVYREGLKKGPMLLGGIGGPNQANLEAYHSYCGV